jgi:hypothetical protein
MRDGAISIADLNQLRLWIESKPEVPEGDWYKDFGSFKICGQGASGEPASGRARRGRIAPESAIPLQSQIANRQFPCECDLSRSAHV